MDEFRQEYTHLGEPTSPVRARASVLHTYPGAVSVLSLIYDKEKRVQLLIDKGLMNVTYIGCHPCTNTCSLKIKMEDILTVWLPATGHDDMKVIE